MTDLTTLPADYRHWLISLKQRIQGAQQRATLSVNRELVLLYWHIGRDILERQQAQGWGAKIVDQLAKDLTAAFPDMKGFSRSNLMYMRAFHQAWPDESIVQQLVGQLPWGQNLLLLTKLKTRDERVWYATQPSNTAGRAMSHVAPHFDGVAPALRQCGDLARYLPSIAQIEAELLGDDGSSDEYEAP